MGTRGGGGTRRRDDVVRPPALHDDAPSREAPYARGSRHPDPQAAARSPEHAVHPVWTSRAGAGSVAGAPGMPIVRADDLVVDRLLRDDPRLEVTGPERQPRRGDVEDRVKRGVVARLEDEVARPGLVRDDQARTRPSVGIAEPEEPSDAAPASSSAASTSPPSRVRRGPGGLRCTAARAPRRTNAAERRRRPSALASTRSRALTTTTRSLSPADRGEQSDGVDEQRRQQEQRDALGDVTQPAAPRRGVAGSSVAARSAPPPTVRAAAAAGRQAGCSHRTAPATDTSPARPDTSPTSAAVPLEYCRVRSISTRQESSATAVPAIPSETASGAIRTSSNPTDADSADQDLVRRANLDRDAGRIDRGRVGGDVGGGVQRRGPGADGVQRQPGEHAAGHHGEHEHGRQHDGGRQCGAPDDEPGGQEDRPGDGRRGHHRATRREQPRRPVR